MFPCSDALSLPLYLRPLDHSVPLGSVPPLGGIDTGDYTPVWTAVTAEQSCPCFKLLYFWLISCPALTYLCQSHPPTTTTTTPPTRQVHWDVCYSQRQTDNVTWDTCKSSILQLPLLWQFTPCEIVEGWVLWIQLQLWCSSKESEPWFGCVNGGGQMVRRLPDLSFCGRLIVS